VKLVPGCRVVLHGSSLSDVWVSHDTDDVTGLDFGTYVPGGTQALVVSVTVFNDRDPMFTTVCSLFSPKHGFFRIVSTRFHVVWSPVQGDGKKG
jgi:hypothetical protein